MLSRQVYFLVRLIGYTWTCIIATAITGAIAAAAYLLAHEQDDDPQTLPSGFHEAPTPCAPHAVFPLYAICFVSGFGFLALEVLWTHLLAQIHTNSVYSFSTVLVIVLLALGLGAAAASRLARLRAHPTRVLASLLILGGVAVTACPFVFMAATNGFRMLYTGTHLPFYP